MGRDENVIVFKDTENLCKTNPRISEAVKRSTSAQKLILEGDALAEQKKDVIQQEPYIHREYFVKVLTSGIGWISLDFVRRI